MQVLRIIGFIVLIVVLFTSLFKVQGADLTNNVTAVALMVLLLSIFSDLKEFNFWGLTGKRQELEKDLQQLAGKEAVNEAKLPKASKAKVQQIRMNTEIVHESSDMRSELLDLTFEIEKLLKVLGVITPGVTVSEGSDTKDIAKALERKGIVTTDGLNQIEKLFQIRSHLLRGDDKLFSNTVLATSVTIARDLYNNLKNWIDNPSS